MSNYLCVDCETSGLFRFKDAAGNSVPADAPGQPRLAHASLIWLDADLVQEREEDFYIKPDGWVMETGATKVNGLTTEFLLENGKPIAEVLDLYEATIKEGRIVVAFNAAFDTKCFRAELRRAGRDDLFEQTPNICTMRELTGVCKIPKKSGNGYKFPKLSEACAHFKLVQGKQHTATDDNRMNAELLRKLKWLGLMPDPAVHFARNRPEPVTDGISMRKITEYNVGEDAKVEPSDLAGGPRFVPERTAKIGGKDVTIQSTIEEDF